MSVFEEGANPPKEEPITENFLENLVGEGKKFTDPEALARGKYEADKFIEDLKRQNAELREDMEKAAKLDELMELVRNQQTAPKDTNNPPVDPNDTRSDQMTPEELKALIESHVSERDKAVARQRNLEEADRLMRDKFGEGAGTAIARRASEVDMTVDEIKDLASKNPKAFSRLMGLGESKQEPSTLVGKTQRSESGTVKNGGTRDFAYYQKLRRENPGLYYKPATQAQLMKDREAIGESFYGTHNS